MCFESGFGAAPVRYASMGTGFGGPRGRQTVAGWPTDGHGPAHGRGQKRPRTGPVGAVTLTAPTRIPARQARQSRRRRPAALSRIFRQPLGRALSNLGRAGEADEHLHTALAIFTELGENYHQARTMYVIALTWLASGQPEQAAEAISRFERALTLMEAEDHPLSLSGVLTALAVAYARTENKERARSCVDRTAELQQQLNLPEPSRPRPDQIHRQPDPLAKPTAGSRAPVPGYRRVAGTGAGTPRNGDLHGPSTRPEVQPCRSTGGEHLFGACGILRRGSLQAGRRSWCPIWASVKA